MRWWTLAFPLLAAAFGALAQSRDTLTYQGAVLEPGDVINFLGGGATTGHQQTYGHTGLYLGTDPQTHKKVFLDFSTTKGGPLELVFGTPQPFNGRLLGEEDFLRWNGKYHQGFDVFRLRSGRALDQAAMVRQAKELARKESWGPLGQVCSSAAAMVLSKGAGTTVDVYAPDGFLNPPFQRHPQLTGKSLNIQAALRDASRRSDLEREKVRNDARIKAIDRQAAPLGKERRSALEAIARHEKEQPDRRDKAAVKAYNDKSDELNENKRKVVAQLAPLKDEQDRLAARNKEIEAQLN